MVQFILFYLMQDRESCIHTAVSKWPAVCRKNKENPLEKNKGAYPK